MEVVQFKKLIKEHKSANHSVFDKIEDLVLKDELTKEQYYLFAVNIATRTMMSLPEIHACCIQASLDLDPLRTTYSVMTGAEEGGSGNPKEVHSVLMMNALNYHGKVVYQMEPINLKYLMSLTRLVYYSQKLFCFYKLEAKYNGIGNDLISCSFINIDEIKEICIRMAKKSTIEANFDSLKEVKKAEEIAFNKLIQHGVLKETIDYCLEQMAVLINMKTGYLQGVGFAHEALADGMIDKMFRILYPQVNKYNNYNDFIENVYPYFSAHGNYLEVYNGASEEAEGVEVTHALREIEKLNQLDKEALKTAWIGANNFANRNVKIWDSMMDVLVKSQQLNYSL